MIRHSLLGLGVATISTAGLAMLDHPAIHELSRPRVLRHEDLHEIAGDFAAFGGLAPFALSSVLAVVGTGHPQLQRFAIHDVEAIALATALTGVTKGIVGRALPDVAAKHAFQLGRGFHDGNGPFVSFPSGHTAAAFAFASTFASEVSRDSVPHAALLGAAAFGIATGVGLARVVQRVHWPSDLPIGAFFGMWSGYAVQARSNRRGASRALQRTATDVSLVSDGPGRIGLAWSSSLP